MWSNPGFGIRSFWCLLLLLGLVFTGELWGDVHENIYEKQLLELQNLESVLIAVEQDLQSSKLQSETLERSLERISLSYNALTTQTQNFNGYLESQSRSLETLETNFRSLSQTVVDLQTTSVQLKEELEQQKTSLNALEDLQYKELENARGPNWAIIGIVGAVVVGGGIAAILILT